jgi:hypothetical protein
MPSLTIAAAILILGNAEELPWTSETWQSLTKFFAIPWETPDGAAPDAPSPHVPSWNTRIAQCVKSYVENLRSKTDQQAQIDYATRGFSDNDSTGRTAWNKWINENWQKHWKLHKQIDDLFAEHKCSPYHTLTRVKSKKVCSWSIHFVHNLNYDLMIYTFL